MTFVDQLEELWTTSQSKSLGETLIDAIALIAKARENDEQIPLDLELDIVNTANYTMGYGEQSYQLPHFLDLWKKSTLSLGQNDALNNKIFRLVSITIELVLNSLMNDPTLREEGLPELFHRIFEVELDGVVDVLRFLFDTNNKILSNEYSGSWKQECLVAQVTLYSLIQEQNLHEEIEEAFASLRDLMSQFDSERWNAKKNHNSDSFRFTYLMLFNTHPDGQRWLRNSDFLWLM